MALRSLIVLFCLYFSLYSANADYWTTRNEFIKKEDSMAVGSKVVLNEKEQAVNKLLMAAKVEELESAFENPELFPPARHFFEAKADIEKSKVFSIIKKMPKGGGLHMHDTALSSTDYVLYNITYREHLLLCEEDDGNIKMAFADPPPQDECWKSVKLLRQEAKVVEDFDEWLRSKMTMVTDNPGELYPNLNEAWRVFQGCFDVVTPLVSYQPVFLDYFYNGLLDLYNDNVNYAEIRGTLPWVYDLSGWPANPIQVLAMLRDVADQFMADHPDFIGVKYIYAPHRNVDDITVEDYIAIYNQMQELFPDFLVGFDLVGQEDKGKPLANFIDQLQEVEEGVKFFFHSGETNWNGMSTDMNLVDAVLLNTTRIGHGYALVKHPAVMEEVKRRGIGIEVNPISNQVLMLVKDLRNHPANILLAQDYPVVISNDSPSYWGAQGLSYDFYEAFMGMASANADLRMLKQLALNSLLYSALSAEEKENAILKWEVKWNKFLDEILML